MRNLHISTSINGDDKEFICGPDETLLDVLRDRLGLTMYALFGRLRHHEHDNQDAAQRERGRERKNAGHTDQVVQRFEERLESLIGNNEIVSISATIGFMQTETEYLDHRWR